MECNKGFFLLLEYITPRTQRKALFGFDWHHFFRLNLSRYGSFKFKEYIPSYIIFNIPYLEIPFPIRIIYDSYIYIET